MKTLATMPHNGKHKTSHQPTADTAQHRQLVCASSSWLPLNSIMALLQWRRPPTSKFARTLWNHICVLPQGTVAFEKPLGSALNLPTCCGHISMCKMKGHMEDSKCICYGLCCFSRRIPLRMIWPADVEYTKIHLNSGETCSLRELHHSMTW